MLCIVYEVASCPWTDYVKDDHETDTDKMSQSKALVLLTPTKDASPLLSSSIYLSCPLQRFRDEFDSSPPICELIVRCMLLRAQYGGMRGDITMIDRYVHLWRKRFLLPCVHKDVAQRVTSSRIEQQNDHAPSATEELMWWDVPRLVHERAKIQSAKHVATVATQGLEKLLIKDVCVEGVDFHCSAVLTVIVSDPELHATCCEELCRITDQSRDIPTPAGAHQRRSWVLDVLKDCMWKFSSGINLRRPLQGSHSNQKKDESSRHCEELLKKFWDEFIAETAQAYMKNYVKDRLFR